MAWLLPANPKALQQPTPFVETRDADGSRLKRIDPAPCLKRRYAMQVGVLAHAAIPFAKNIERRLQLAGAMHGQAIEGLF